MLLLQNKLSEGLNLNYFLLVFLIMTGCGVFPEKVKMNDKRLIPLFEAMKEVRRDTLGFSAIDSNSEIRLETANGSFFSRFFLPTKNYDVMLHIDGKTSMTIAFKKVGNDKYAWIGEQETYYGKRNYTTVDGTFKEEIMIDYDKIPIAGWETNKINIEYNGPDSTITPPNKLTLAEAQQMIKKWNN